jgi:hypothetical protein
VVVGIVDEIVGIGDFDERSGVGQSAGTVLF